MGTPAIAAAITEHRRDKKSNRRRQLHFELQEKIEASQVYAAMFEAIHISASAAAISGSGLEQNKGSEGFRGDNVSPDLREMLARDPAGSSRIDVVLQAKDADNAALRSLLSDGTARIADRIGQTDTLVLNLPLSVVQTLSTSGLINYVSPDRAMQGSGHVEDTTGAAAIRSQQGSSGAYTLDGSGVGVAIIDSGVYTGHTGFRNGQGLSRVTASVDFTGSGVADSYGHGTHVAGLAAGSSTKNGGAYRGVASGANIISVKVLNNNGTGQTSWLLNGMNWILQNREQHNIRVVNMSLGTLARDTYTNDPLCRKVKELSDAGIVVVAAAGNLGRGTNGGKFYGMIHSPGNSPHAITVGLQ